MESSVGPTERCAILKSYVFFVAIHIHRDRLKIRSLYLIYLTGGLPSFIGSLAFGAHPQIKSLGGQRVEVEKSTLQNDIAQDSEDSDYASSSHSSSPHHESSATPELEPPRADLSCDHSDIPPSRSAQSDPAPHDVKQAMSDKAPVASLSMLDLLAQAAGEQRRAEVPSDPEPKTALPMEPLRMPLQPPMATDRSSMSAWPMSAALLQQHQQPHPYANYLYTTYLQHPLFPFVTV